MYRAGDRVELVFSGEDYSPVPLGTHGTVSRVAPVAQISSGGPWLRIEIDWDSGRSGSVMVPPDRLRVLR